jgi:hypothetical protein
METKSLIRQIQIKKLLDHNVNSKTIMNLVLEKYVFSVGRVNYMITELKGNLLALKFHKFKMLLIFSRGTVYHGIRHLHI